MKQNKYTRAKDCYCHTCGKAYHHLGIATHRSMHRNKNEDCKIKYNGGVTWIHNFSRRGM